MPDLGMPMSKSKDDLARLKFMVKIQNFDTEVKDQGHTEVMNVCNIVYHGDTFMCQT